jgi:hypothetical protein
MNENLTTLTMTEDMPRIVHKNTTITTVTTEICVSDLIGVDRRQRMTPPRSGIRKPARGV